jgi:mono/diheme cytochrome c family protein
MRIEIKGLIAALVAMVVVLGGAFGLSAIMVSRSHQAPFQSMSDSMKTGKQTMTASMKADKQKMSASMSAADMQAQLVQGHQFFTVSCASCHGAKGQGAFGPSLYNSDLTDAKIAAVITNGVKGRMPAFGRTYKGPQVQALTAYIRSLKK